MKRLAACLLGSTFLALSLCIYAEYIFMLGFPDGYVTELGRAESKLAWVFIVGSVVSGAYLIYLGAMATRKPVGGKLTVATVLSLLMAVGVVLVDRYYQSHLSGGGGG